MKAKLSELQRNYLLPKGLARMLRCSEKRVREYCKRGKIREAKKTPGGQWRIPKQLSQKTWAFLQREAFLIDWPWVRNGKEFQGELDDDWETAQGLLELIWYGGETIPPSDEVDVGPENLAGEERIRNLIWEKIKNGESLSSLILKGRVYQFWLKNQREPTVSDIVELMQISWTEFYRRKHNLKEIRDAYYECAGIGDEPTMETF